MAILLRNCRLTMQIIAAILSVASAQITLEDLLQQEWTTFKVTYNKTYKTTEEERFRRENFIENRHKIAVFNQGYAEGHASFYQQVNAFGDMLHHEFNQVLNGFNRTRPRVEGREERTLPKGSTYISSANVIFPDYVDWREVGAVSPVKYQGSCGGCYAFSAAGALEGHNFRRTGRLVELSPQNLIDCTQPYGNDGCLGGLMDPSFQYVKDNSGIDTDQSYPYEAQEVKCRYTQAGFGAVDTGFVDIPEGDEKSLEAAVATLGPISVAIDASRPSLQSYAGGVYYDSGCGNKTEEMNHAVLVVGYGAEADGRQYWIVKNSYGTSWGESGYIKMAKFVDNHCGIATIASYPLM